MSKRSDIIDGRQSHLKYGLIYTEVLGWIDLGHAQGTDIRKLLRDIDAGESSGKPQLERPGKEDWKHFRVTFDGDQEGGVFGVRGGASGVGLQISDNLGNIASPGKVLPFVDIIPGSMQLNYSLKLVANNHALKSGDYYSSIRFKMDYF
ncbi:fimbrial protein [Enterobacter kobei]|uniref:fimbrial protein n=1 Tax=Enterobacter kobei TaxID=208224 RepID=UPI001ABDF151|nr:hypothetical protein [Enterobacter kobei]MBO4154588.1 hypothetical protein [Enterobacter kobei]UOY68654.1 hypothetical protein LCD42_22135 [Enterobacter kobei]